MMQNTELKNNFVFLFELEIDNLFWKKKSCKTRNPSK